MSQFITWTQDMSVGSDLLDDHHKIIVDCLNALQPVIGQSGHEAEVREVVDRLEHFVLVHFSEEERAMIEAGYPDWKGHKALHDRMYDVIFDIKADIGRGRLVDAAELFGMINDWLVQHILGEDRKYMPYLQNPQPHADSVWTSDHRKHEGFEPHDAD
jgi:hemerythrin-like metal-binding protein